MTENIHPRYESKDGLMLNMAERLTRVETKLDALNEKIENLIKDTDPRIQKLEAKSNQAEGALKMLKYGLSAIGAVVLTIIGYLFKIR